MKGRGSVGTLRKPVTWLPDIKATLRIYADMAASLLAVPLHIPRGI